MPGLSAFENIELPLKLQGARKAVRKEKVKKNNGQGWLIRGIRPLSK